MGENDAIRAELMALRELAIETLGRLSGITEDCIQISRRAAEHLDSIDRYDEDDRDDFVSHFIQPLAV